MSCVSTSASREPSRRKQKTSSARGVVIVFGLAAHAYCSDRGIPGAALE